MSTMAIIINLVASVVSVHLQIDSELRINAAPDCTVHDIAIRRRWLSF